MACWTAAHWRGCIRWIARKDLWTMPRPSFLKRQPPLSYGLTSSIRMDIRKLTGVRPSLSFQPASGTMSLSASLPPTACTFANVEPSPSFLNIESFPSISFHGLDDRVSPPEQVVRFAKAMKRKKNQCELHSFPREGHSFFNFNVNMQHFESTINAADQFLTDQDFLSKNELDDGTNRLAS